MDMPDLNISMYESDNEPGKSKIDIVFETLGLSPIDISRIQKRDYLDNKMDELRAALLTEMGISKDDECVASTKALILDNVKENYTGFNKEQKVAVLTILPKRWPVAEICRTTGAGQRLVTSVRNGTVDLVRKIQKNKISRETVENVEDFYLDETNSRILPGI